MLAAGNQKRRRQVVATAGKLSTRRLIMRTIRFVTALSVAGAVSLASYAPAQAAPITPLSIASKPVSQAGSVIQVRWGGGWRGGGWGWRGGGFGWGVGALAAGAVIGAAIAGSPYYGGGYYPAYG